MTGSCNGKWRNTGYHLREAGGNTFFNILLVSSCSTIKKINAQSLCTAPVQVLYGAGGEYVLGRSTRSDTGKELQVPISSPCEFKGEE